MSSADPLTEIPEALRRLVRRSWEIFDKSQQLPCLVKESIPVLFYGDLSRYLTSPLKVVTSANNPSSASFQTLKRFPTGLAPSLRDNDAGYLKVLEGHFHPMHRYESKWFRGFTEILEQFDCSYYGDRGSVALHSDLLTPLATKPNWRKLDGSWRRQLEADGVPLWNRLIEYLAPDVVLISSSFPDHSDKIRFGEQRSKWDELVIPDVQVAAFAIARKVAHVVFAKGNVRPFMFDAVKKFQLGAAIRDLVLQH